MASKEYSEIPQQEQDALTSSDVAEFIRPEDRHQKSWLRIVFLLSLALAAALPANLLVLWKLCHPRPLLADDGISKYARLARDVPVERPKNTSFSSVDREVQDKAWNDPIFNTQLGFVALDDSYTESMGMWHAARWPWDDNKGVYVVASAHELHCLQAVRQSINELTDGLVPSWPYKHQIHCLDVLRQSIICNADDEPLYSGALHSQLGSKHPSAGVGSVRMCRDWNKLVAWEKERTACVLPIGPGQPEMTRLERYKQCPNGERPWEHSKGQYGTHDP